MKLRTVFAAVTLGITALACTGGEAVDTQNDKLSTPWKEMNLPVGSGEILVNGSDVLLIGWQNYSGGLSTLDASWTGAVEAAGYKQTENLSADGINAYIYNKGSSNIGLATLEEDDVLGAYMEDLGKVKDSDIKNGRVRDGYKSRRGGGGGGGGAKAGTPNRGGGSPGKGGGGKGGGGKRGH